MGQPMTKIRLNYVHEYRDRHGKVRRYYRKGGKRVPLPGIPGSADFMRAYQLAVSGKVAPVVAFEAGTLPQDLEGNRAVHGSGGPGDIGSVGHRLAG